MVSFRRTLLRLDVSGLGVLALPVLLRAILEQLQLLRVGECGDSRGAHLLEHTYGQGGRSWPAGVTVDQIGGALPSLTALDVGFADCIPVRVVDLHRLRRPPVSLLCATSSSAPPRPLASHGVPRLRLGG